MVMQVGVGRGTVLIATVLAIILAAVLVATVLGFANAVWIMREAMATGIVEATAITAATVAATAGVEGCTGVN